MSAENPTYPEMQAARAVILRGECGADGHPPDQVFRDGTPAILSIVCRCGLVRWVKDRTPDPGRLSTDEQRAEMHQP